MIPDPYFEKFIIGDEKYDYYNRGNLNVIDFATGKLDSVIHAHKNEIYKLKVLFLLRWMFKII